MVYLDVGLYSLGKGKVYTKVQSLINIPEGIEGRFEVVWTGMVVVGQEKGHNWVEVKLSVHGKTVESTN